MFFNVLGSIATFITGTLAGILIGSKGGDSPAPIDFGTPEAPAAAAAPVEPTPTEDAPAGKPEGQMPEEQDIDEEWDKD